MIQFHESSYDRMISGQSIRDAVQTGLIASVVALVPVYLFSLTGIKVTYGFKPLILIAPGLLAAIVAKMYSKMIQLRYRILFSAIVFAALLVFALFQQPEAKTFYIAVAFGNLLPALLFSRKHLTAAEEQIVFRHRMGLDEA